MALSRKTSRPITVDGESYRWHFSESISRWNDVTVQSSAGHGQKLVVRYPWQHSGTPDISMEPITTPREVEQLIRAAQKIGWAPTSPGPTFKAQWIDNKLSKGHSLDLD